MPKTIIQTPDIGSLAYDVCMYFVANPDEELEVADINAKFIRACISPRKALSKYVEAGLLIHRGLTYTAGPKLLVAMQPSVGDAVMAMAEGGASSRKKQYTPPPIDQVELTLEPIAKRHNNSKWRPYLDLVASADINDGRYPTARFPAQMTGALKKAIEDWNKRCEPKKLRCTISGSNALVQRVA